MFSDLNFRHSIECEMASHRNLSSLVADEVLCLFMFCSPSVFSRLCSVFGSSGRASVGLFGQAPLTQQLFVFSRHHEHLETAFVDRNTDDVLD